MNRTSKLALRMLCLPALLVISTTGLANEAQNYICQAGMGLGQAESRIELFGRLGAIPPDQLAAIGTNLAGASAAITMAEMLFNAPFQTNRANTNPGKNATDKIADYMVQTSKYSDAHKANYIKNIYDNYRSSLEYTWVSSRPSAFEWKPTCDSLILKACYHFGRATTAAAIDEHFAQSYQSGAVGGMRDAIDSGLSIAMDVGFRPYDGHAKKICCSFGAPAAWSPVLANVQLNSAHAVFDTYEDVILGIVSDAAQLDPVCGSSEHAICASSGVQAHKRSSANFGGTWNCSFGGGVARIVQSGSALSGSWSAEGDSVSISGSVTGRTASFRWQYSGASADYTADLSADGNTMSGTVAMVLPGWGEGSEPFSCTRR